ncbi:hypothetical protein [Erysipelothrix larvae]|nr:hypothetical protein [Erysipelothrix larvae]
MFNAEKQTAYELVMILYYVGIFITVITVVWGLFDQTIMIEHPYHLF